VNVGTSRCSDIEPGLNAALAAEVFAAVNTSNNRNVAKDLANVRNSSALLKYVLSITDFELPVASTIAHPVSGRPETAGNGCILPRKF
jgi:hypothetical protein